MADKNQTKPDFDQMSTEELLKYKNELMEKISEKERFLEEENLRVIESHPETKTAWEEMKKAEKEAEGALAFNAKKQNHGNGKTERKPEESDAQKRLKLIKEALYTTAMEHDEESQVQISDKTRKEIDELREKMRLLENQKRETSDKEKVKEKVRDLRDETKGKTPEQKAHQEPDKEMVEQKVKEIEKNAPEKNWEHSGTREEIVEMLRQKAKN